MANFEVFRRVISSSKNLFFLKSAPQDDLEVPKRTPIFTISSLVYYNEKGPTSYIRNGTYQPIRF